MCRSARNWHDTRQDCFARSWTAARNAFHVVILTAGTLFARRGSRACVCCPITPSKALLARHVYASFVAASLRRSCPKSAYATRPCTTNGGALFDVCDVQNAHAGAVPFDDGFNGSPLSTGFKLELSKLHGRNARRATLDSL